MASEFIESPDDITLIEQTGVQFTDFKLDLSNADEYDKVSMGFYILGSEEKSVAKCVKNKNLLSDKQLQETDSTTDLNKYKNLVTGEDNISENTIFIKASLEEAISAYENKWFPLPFLKKLDDKSAFSTGPSSWARGFFKKIENTNNEYHLVIAFDTSIDRESEDEYRSMLFPSTEDVSSGARFSLCNNYFNINDFLKNDFIDEWLLKIWKEYAEKEDLSQSKYQRSLSDLQYKTFYINILSILINTKFIRLPCVKFRKFDRTMKDRSVPVDLVLDVGNSRTCALFVETHPGEKALSYTYQLNLRDFEDPTIRYTDAFPSRVEFAIPSFCNERNCVSPSGASPFLWSSMVRIGYEAQKLSWKLNGNEGLTGLSSPKRYLWDDDEQRSLWYINPSLTNHEAVNANFDPIQTYVTQAGEAVFWDEDNDSVYEPKYSRQSLMTFLLNEIIAHSYCVINSVYQRLKMKSKDDPRYLNSIILTVPPGMPREEIEIYERCMKSAIGIYWKAMKWDNTGDSSNVFTMTETQKTTHIWPMIPKIEINWDEAICGQVVYLYNEVVQNYNNNYDNFFKTVSKSKKDNLTLATVDIGGGTSDIVINRFSITGNGDAIFPKQLFRESFKVAGDDILLDVITKYVVPSIKSYLKNKKVDEDEILRILARKIGGSSEGTAQEKNLKKILTLQLFEPLGLKILAAYEKYGTKDFARYNVDNKTFAEILGNGCAEISDNVIKYISEDFGKLIGDESFSILNVVLHIDFAKLNTFFATCTNFDICEKVFSYMSEVIHAYNCDIVLLTGRPSKLPGILSCFRNRIGIPPERVIPMHSYRMSDWYPMLDAGYISDPKTTAAVGALICYLSATGKLSGFNLKSLAIKIKSCVKFLGRLDANCERLYNASIFYSDLNFDDPNYKLKETFKVSGPIVIGYRSMPLERWPASMLYKLTLSEHLSRQMNSRAEATIEVKLGRDLEGDEEAECCRELSTRLIVDSVKSSDKDVDFNEQEDVKLKLCTLPDRGLADNAYWLDSGSVLVNE